jgi:hypothetical protein
MDGFLDGVILGDSLPNRRPELCDRIIKKMRAAQIAKCHDDILHEKADKD